MTTPSAALHSQNKKQLQSGAGVRESPLSIACALGSMQNLQPSASSCVNWYSTNSRPGQRKYIALIAQNTLPLVQNSTIEIGSTSSSTITNNLALQMQVCFAVTTYVSVVRAAMRANAPAKPFKNPA